MATIHLESLQWVEAPAIPQPVTILIKLKDDPDVESSYQVIATGVIVLVDGSFNPPYDITGLDSHGQYTVKIVTVCGDNSFTKDFEASPDAAAYSYGFSLGFYS